MTISSMKNTVQENAGIIRKGNASRSQYGTVIDLVVDPDIEQVFNDAAKRKEKRETSEPSRIDLF